MNEKVQNTGEPMPNFFFMFGLRFLALGSGWGVNEKVQNAGGPMPNFVSGSDLDFWPRVVGWG